MNYCTGKMELAQICYNCEQGGCKYEWKNCYEKDGTPDNSAWTSIKTDGMLETSPSVDQKLDDSTDNVEVEDGEESVSVSVSDPVVCTSCKYDSKKKQTTCFNGMDRIPKEDCDEFNGPV